MNFSQHKSLEFMKTQLALLKCVFFPFPPFREKSNDKKRKRKCNRAGLALLRRQKSFVGKVCKLCHVQRDLDEDCHSVDAHLSLECLATAKQDLPSTFINMKTFVLLTSRDIIYELAPISSQGRRTSPICKSARNIFLMRRNDDREVRWKRMNHPRNPV